MADDIRMVDRNQDGTHDRGVCQRSANDGRLNGEFQEIFHVEFWQSE